jgi:exonuclease III
MNNIFKHGVAYVALSRVTTLSGLNILHPNPKTIYTNPAITPAIANLPNAETTNLWRSLLPSLQLPSQSLKIASLNIEGLNNNLPKLLNHYFLSHMDIFLLQETSLPSLTQPSPANYKLISKPRCTSYKATSTVTATLQQAQKGGTAILFKHHLHIHQLNTQHINAELQAFSLASTSKTPAITLINAYRPPSLPVAHFAAQLDILLNTLSSQHPALIAGDFNIDLMQPHSTSPLTQTIARHNLWIV